MRCLLLALCLTIVGAGSAAIAASLTIVSPFGTATPQLGLVPLQAPGLGGTAYPPGAQTCVAAAATCPASAPNTVGNPCTCPTANGGSTSGVVR